MAARVAVPLAWLQTPPPQLPEGARCGACTEAFTADRRRAVVCPACAYAACEACCIQYVTGDAAAAAEAASMLSRQEDGAAGSARQHAAADAARERPLRPLACMACGVHWDADAVAQLFQLRTRRGALRRHARALLLAAERDLFAHTRLVLASEAAAKEVTAAAAARAELVGRLSAAVPASPREALAALTVTPARADALNASLQRVLGARGALREAQAACFGAADASGGGSRPVAARRCASPTCARGRLTVHGVCGACALTTCALCFTAYDAPAGAHACDPATRASVALVRENTKECPSCGGTAQRQEGCRHMWCFGCHAFFDWNTLRLLRGVVHNPDHQQWRAWNGQRVAAAVRAAAPREAPREPREAPREPREARAVRREWNAAALAPTPQFWEGLLARGALRGVPTTTYAPTMRLVDVGCLRDVVSYLFNALRGMQLLDDLFSTAQAFSEYGPLRYAGLRAAHLRGDLSVARWEEAVTRRDAARARVESEAVVWLAMLAGVAPCLWDLRDSVATRDGVAHVAALVDAARLAANRRALTLAAIDARGARGVARIMSASWGFVPQEFSVQTAPTAAAAALAGRKRQRRATP